MRPASGNKFHIVNAYGYHNLNGTNGFIVHYGWRETYSQVWTNQNWYDGSIRMNVGHTHTWVDNGNTLNYTVSANTHREARCTTCDARKPVDLYNTSNISGNTIEIDSVASIGGRKIQLSGDAIIPSTLKGRTVTKIGESAFANQTSLTRIIFSMSLTDIGNSAFKNCTNLTSVIFSFFNSISTIGNAAFSGCPALTGISLPSNITKIGFEAFSPSTALTRFNGNRADIDLIVVEGTKDTYIANGWTGFNIVELSASGPLKVTSGQLRGVVNVPAYFNNRAVTEIGDRAFANQSQLTAIILLSVTKIGDSAFANCSELEGIFYPSLTGLASTPNHSTSYTNYYYTERCLDVELISGFTYTLSFSYSNLTSSTDITNVFTSLGVGENTFAVDLPVQKAFGSESGTQTIVFTPTEAQLSSSKKLWCRFIRTSTPQTVSIDIKNVRIGFGVTSVDIDAFTGCDKLATAALKYRLLPDDTYAVTGSGDGLAAILFGLSRTLFIPSFYEGKRVTQIDAGAFANNEFIKWAFFQSELTAIGNRAFQFCYNLQTVNLSETAVTRIEDYTFDTCALGHFSFPKNLKYIGEGAFIRAGAVSNMPDSVTTIADYAFAYRDVSGVNLPNELLSIGAYSFANCGFTILTNENTKLTVIGPYAFYNTPLAANTKIPAAVISIGDSAFRNSGFSPKFALPADSRLFYIGPNAFTNCGLTRIVLPSTVAIIEAGAFSENANLTIYAEQAGRTVNWSSAWNSGNRPVIWGCTLSSDKSYVISFTKSASSPSNANATNGITEPYRKDYIFGGWYTTPDFSGTQYTDLTAAPNGTLYAKWEEASCVAEGTLITLADGTQKAVEDLTGDEMLLVWNLFTGQFDAAPILFIDSDPAREYEVINLRFSDGTVVKVIDEHGFWDFNLNEYVFLRGDAAKYIGHWFNKQTADASGNMAWIKVQLTNVVVQTEYTTAWSPVTYGHLCYYVNGMLSMPGATTGLINIFDVDPDTMKIDQAAMQADIAEYGLFTYEEFAALYPVPEVIFEAFGGQYLKIAMGKGLLTEEMLNSLIARYSIFFL